MRSISDLISLVIFAGIAILYLQRSASHSRDPASLWMYGVAALGCAVGNYLGNHGQVLASGVVFVAVVAFSIIMLRPFQRPPEP